MTAPPEFPPTVDRERVLAPMLHSGWENSAQYRRDMVELDPLLFALCYLPGHLRSPETGGRISFSRLHVALAAGARRWALQPDVPIREGWIAPRAAAKSTWSFLILPLWALATGARSYVLAFADSGAQAEGHLATLRRELETNRLLLHDFPELAPRRGAGARNTARDLDLVGGGTMSARGMDAKTLGAKSGADRPDLLLGDDLEPPGARYSPEQKAKRLSSLTDAILPMNDRAAVMLVGTVTMYGSIMHDLVRHALGEHTEEWITAEGFRGRYFPPVITHPDGSRESCWPQRWSLADLDERATRGRLSWRLNFLNRPSRAGEDGVGWVPSLFTRGQVPAGARTVMIDPATTSRSASDQTGVVVGALSDDGARVVLDFCRGYRVNPGELRGEVQRLVSGPERGVRTVVIEVNQGGQTWGEIMRPMPPGVALREHVTRSRKATRIDRLLDAYERGLVVHARPLDELEAQMLDHHPGAKHDDLIDACSILVGSLLPGTVPL